MGLRMSDQELAGLVVKRGTKAAPKPKSDGVSRWQALGRLKDGALNKTEQAFAALLDQWKHEGKVLWWKAHAFNIRLADNTYYRIDFIALTSANELVIYETKGGYTSDKGQMKIKLAAEALPVMRIFKATKQDKKAGGGFKLEEF